jgi:sigma-B regulation protein RsbU (phosphoserine phosphatase)
MADVADKGMPAALFMTLVRTLLRATVSQVDSPAAVLMRVNDIIAPEAYKGMFVTLFYGVLDLDTGALEYANAGHNPPLLMRPAVCAVERLERTGMALGVEEHTRLSDGKCRIAPGDALILYTDGVTEAFDPSGDIFTEARLLETIQRIMCQATPPDAAAILDEIDAAVKGFTAGADASDDLTLLVIKYSGA